MLVAGASAGETVSEVDLEGGAWCCPGVVPVPLVVGLARGWRRREAPLGRAALGSRGRAYARGSASWGWPAKGAGGRGAASAEGGIAWKQWTTRGGPPGT